MIDKNFEQYILNVSLNSNGKINPYQLYNIIFKNEPDIKIYLMNRYTDIPTSMFSYSKVIYRIKNNINTRPVCPVCGKPLIYRSQTIGYSIVCSKKCTYLYNGIKEKRKQICLEKYGVEYSTQSEQVKEKTKQTCLNRYGTICYSKTEEFKEKSKQTCLEKYGYEYHSQVPEVKTRKVESIRKTMQERYGVDFYTQAPDFYDKYKQTCLLHYGYEHAMQSDLVKRKCIVNQLM